MATYLENLTAKTTAVMVKTGKTCTYTLTTNRFFHDFHQWRSQEFHLGGGYKS